MYAACSIWTVTLGIELWLIKFHPVNNVFSEGAAQSESGHSIHLQPGLSPLAVCGLSLELPSPKRSQAKS